MLQQLTEGWKLVRANQRTLLAVSLYHVLWTVLIYILIRKLITPIVRSIPSGVGTEVANQYFWIEARFLAVKTDVLLPYLFLFLGLMVLRMIISPFIQSGLYGALAQSKQSLGNNRFLSSIKDTWKPFVTIYWTRALVILLPLFMVVYPLIQPLLNRYLTVNLSSLPLTALILLVVWSFVVSSVTYALLIGRVNQLLWQHSLKILFKQAIKLICSALIILAVTFILQTLFQLSSSFILGLLSTTLFFALTIIRTFLKAWTVSTHMVQFK